MAIQPNDRVGVGTTYSDTGVSDGGAQFDRTNDAATGSGSAGNGSAGNDGLRARVASQVKERAGQYSERAKSGLEEQKHRAAHELSNVANALRSCGTDMDTGEESMIAPYVGRVADEVNRLSNMLDTRSVDDIARDVEGFARRNPAVFLGACFGVGILAARFLKSHKPQLPARYVGDGGTFTEYSGPREGSTGSSFGDGTDSGARYDAGGLSSGGPSYGSNTDNR